MPSTRVPIVVALLMLPSLVSGHVDAAAATTAVCSASTISGGNSYSAAISNGELFTWGRNVEGQLGLGFTSTQVTTPSGVTSNPALTNVSGVWAGFTTTFAVDPSGQLWAWGANQNGQRGNGDSFPLSSPAPVGGPTNVVSVGAAFDHGIAATSDGTVWGWGQSSGLGVGDTFFTQNSPAILSTPPRVVKVAAGFRYSLVLTSIGTLYGAGGVDNLIGLGSGSQFVPTFQAAPGLSGLVDVAAGDSIGTPFILIVDGTGHVFASGSNQYGQIGTGTVGSPSTVNAPVLVSGIDSVIQVAAGNGHALALKSDGTVWAWGENDSGQLGIGSTVNSAVPVQVTFPAGTQVVRVAAGLLHSMAVDSAGNLWVWGSDLQGALGTGVVGQNQLAPVKINLAASCPGLPPPPSPPTISSLAPDHGPAEGSTPVTITGTGFTGATFVQFGVGQPLLQPCVSTSTRFCFIVIDDSHITVLSPPHPPGNVDVFVDNAAGFNATVPADVYSFEGWIDPTPSDRSAFDVPVGGTAAFTVKALERGTMTIGYTPLPPFMQCTATANPGQPAEVGCTVSPTDVEVRTVSFFDAADPSRITSRTFIVGRGQYSALGDSFASGEGNPPFIPPTGSDGCNRSDVAYPRTIGKALYNGEERFVACSGAVIKDLVVGSGSPREASQLVALDSSVDLVTVMVGGDDIHFADVATLCVALTTGCEFVYDRLTHQRINRIGNELNAGLIFSPGDGSPRDDLYTLDNIYATIHSRAPNARILVVGYPNLLPAVPLVDCPQNRLAQDEIAWLNSIEADLNDTIAFEAARNGAEFVQGSTTVFTGHELCTVHPYVNGLEQLPLKAPFHPTAEGQDHMAAAVRAQIDRGPPGSPFLVGFGQTVTTTVTVAPGMGQATLSTTWPGSDVGTTLVSPSGRTITRTTSAADVYHLQGPTYEVFSINNPEPGTWTVEMLGTDVSPDGETVLLNSVQLPHFNAPPDASFTSSVTEGTAPLNVSFDADGSVDHDGTVVGYSWDFGDGTTGSSQTATHTFTTPGSYSVHLTVTDDGGLHGFAAGSVLVREPTRLSYTGATAGDFNDPVHLAATLTSVLTGQPVAGMTINLSLDGAGGSQGCVATTDASGTASCDPTLALPSGAYSVSARFDQTDQFAAAATSTTFTGNTEETTLSYTGAPAVAAGRTSTFSAVLLEDGTTPISGRTVVFTLGTGPGAQSCSATTSISGAASCSIAVAQALGPTQLRVAFTGDSFYTVATTTTTVVVFAYLIGGTFVIGDGVAGSPTPVVGTNVTFWSATWNAANRLSGGAAPRDFLGFENSNAAPVCGATWTAQPASSVMPPASLPTYMAVIVADHVALSGSTLSGDTVHIVIVRVDPGYANDPGHAGTGTIVAVLC